MTADMAAIVGIRAVNAALWLILGIDLWRHASTPLPAISRKLIVSVLVGGMIVLLICAFAPKYLPIDVSRMLYTTYTGFAAMVALAVRSTWRQA
jgi:hypothetical protein